MGKDVRLLVAIFFLAAPVFAEEICSYMVAIPREPRPDDFPVVDEGVPWNTRPLFPGPDREELCMDSYRPGSATMGSQVIYMEEEIDGHVVIAKINYYGDIDPFIDRQFISGSSALLGVIVQRMDDGNWYLVVTQKQDYEAPGMQMYVFNLAVEGQNLVVTTSVVIVNIDDNRPMIEAFEVCQTPELGEPRLTECVYNVSDLDGEISTRFMTFRVDSERNDSEIFYMQGSNLPNDWFNMRMTVGIRTPLNFEENALHIFSVTAFEICQNYF